MAAFRKGHVKVVKWLVKHAKQFPADSDCKRFMLTVADKVCFSHLGPSNFVIFDLWSISFSSNDIKDC